MVDGEKTSGGFGTHFEGKMIKCASCNQGLSLKNVAFSFRLGKMRMSSRCSYLNLKDENFGKLKTNRRNVYY